MTAYSDTITEPRSRSDAAASVVDGTKVYGKGATEVRALDGVTLDFAGSQFSAIMGPSGSGKSTWYMSPALTPSPRARCASAGST